MAYACRHPMGRSFMRCHRRARRRGRLYRTDDFGATWRPGAWDRTTPPSMRRLLIQSAGRLVQAFSFSLGAVTLIKSSDGARPGPGPTSRICSKALTSELRPWNAIRSTSAITARRRHPAGDLRLARRGNSFSTLAGGTIRSFFLFPHPRIRTSLWRRQTKALYRIELKNGEDGVSLVLPGDSSSPSIQPIRRRATQWRTSCIERWTAPRPSRLAGTDTAQIGFGISSIAVAPHTSEGRASSRVYVGHHARPAPFGRRRKHVRPDPRRISRRIRERLVCRRFRSPECGRAAHGSGVRARFSRAARRVQELRANLPGSDSVAIASSPPSRAR